MSRGIEKYTRDSEFVKPDRAHQCVGRRTDDVEWYRAALRTQPFPQPASAIDGFQHQVCQDRVRCDPQCGAFALLTGRSFAEAETRFLQRAAQRASAKRV